jgi:hypothetical protein
MCGQPSRQTSKGAKGQSVRKLVIVGTFAIFYVCSTPLFRTSHSPGTDHNLEVTKVSSGNSVVKRPLSEGFVYVN